VQTLFWQICVPLQTSPQNAQLLRSFIPDVAQPDDDVPDPLLLPAEALDEETGASGWQMLPTQSKLRGQSRS